ncbi:MAG: hypothetical protein Fur0041_10300 [Bacteroidia bacterium]
MSEEVYTPDAQGSLGLLALGYKGLQAWRRAKGESLQISHASSGEKGKRKALLIGWDAADWKIIHPLLEAGKLPALASLINNGSHGKIATMDPPLSPMLWTSIATGHTADQHGIVGFIEPDPFTGKVRPVQVTSRKVKAVWNILQQNGHQCHVVGWWPGYPAEPIDGVYVSNVFGKMYDKSGTPVSLPKEAVHPPELQEQLSALRVLPSEITAAHLKPFVPHLEKVDQDKDQSLASIASLIATGASYHNAATWIMEHCEWDFLAVYYNEIDVFSHTFMKYHPPFQQHIDEHAFGLYKGVMEAAYRWHDMMLERLLELCGPETHVVLLSDHGFHSDHLRLEKLPTDPVAPAHEHAPYGICVMSGPRFRKQHTILGAKLADIAPTLLHLFGLPSGKDMYGDVLSQVFLNDVSIAPVESWEKIQGNSGQHAQAFTPDPEAAQLTLQQLADLGYIEKPDDKDTAQAARVIRENKFYLSRVFNSTRRYQEAYDLLEDITKDAPEIMRYQLRLLNTCLKLNKLVRAREVFEHIRKSNAGGHFAPHLLYLEGTLLLSEGRLNEALRKLQLAESKSEGISGIHNLIGQIYLKLKKWDEAKRAFITTLADDQDNAEAHNGLAFAALRLGEYELAADEALSAVQLRYFFPAAHFILGEALYHLGDIKHASEAYSVALSQEPSGQRARLRMEKIAPEALKSILPSVHESKHSKEADEIIIVSGLPRSGTSMMMQMLHAGGVEAVSDFRRQHDTNNPKGYFEDERVKRLHLDISWLKEAVSKSLKVVAPLLPFLPPKFSYKVIFMERDLSEVLTSQQIMLGRDPKNFPLGIAETFRDHLRMAEQWMNTQAHVTFLKVSYAETIQYPEKTAKAIAAFLDKPLNIQAMINAVDEKLYRNKK